MATFWSEDSVIKNLKNLLLLLIPFALWVLPINNNNTDFSFCLIKNVFGKNCFGCGTTRALHSILHLQFRQAFAYNKLIVVVFPLLIYLWLKEITINRKPKRFKQTSLF